MSIKQLEKLLRSLREQEEQEAAQEKFLRQRYKGNTGKRRKR